MKIRMSSRATAPISPCFCIVDLSLFTPVPKNMLTVVCHLRQVWRVGVWHVDLFAFVLGEIDVADGAFQLFDAWGKQHFQRIVEADESHIKGFVVQVGQAETIAGIEAMFCCRFPRLNMAGDQ
ncbi:hypothetical protein PEC301879_04990 [Pectobacterium carotovorum subsp. carotovorum]|nr:hypothetical protein PEC301879_04990 [Pectobacterium carotovorum subsp. carotovorum]